MAAKCHECGWEMVDRDDLEEHLESAHGQEMLGEPDGNHRVDGELAVDERPVNQHDRETTGIHAGRDGSPRRRPRRPRAGTA